MTPFTTNQWIVVALVLVAGWLLGMMSRSGGAKWRTQYEAERDAHARLRRDHDALLQTRDTAVDRGAPVEGQATVTETHVSRGGQRTVVTRD